MSKKLITTMLKATEGEVLQRFADLPNAVVSKTRDYVFVPGSREDRVLLVAHADTVDRPMNKTGRVDPVWHGDICIRSDAEILCGAQYGSGVLGGDDRAGCAALIALWNGEHSLLVTTGEEKGCIGAAVAAREIDKLLSEHRFFIEFDRLGHKQAVFYDVSTKLFEEYVLQSLGDGWHEHQGSYTDIRKICPAAGRCGVNLSIGYTRQHSANEAIYYPAWLNTVVTVKQWLETPDLPMYVLPKRKPIEHGPYPGFRTGSMLASAEARWSRWWDEWNNDFEKKEQQRAAQQKGKISKNAVKKARKNILRLFHKSKISESEARMALLKIGVDPLEHGIVGPLITPPPTPASKALVRTSLEPLPTSVLCYHSCVHCSRDKGDGSAGTWCHKRLDKRGGGRVTSKYGCDLIYDALCPVHSVQSQAVVDRTSEWWQPTRVV